MMSLDSNAIGTNGMASSEPPGAAAFPERRPRILKHSDTFGVFDHYGDIYNGAGEDEGLFHKDTRFLSHLMLFVNGNRPLLLSSTIQDNNALLSVDLTNPEMVDDNGIELGQDTVHILRSKFIWHEHCLERLRLRNFGQHPCRLRLGLAFGADFADLFEVRGLQRSARGTTDLSVPDKNTVELRYTARDDQVCRTLVQFSEPPQHLSTDLAQYDLTLAPDCKQNIYISVSCMVEPGPDKPKTHFLTCLRAAHRAQRTASHRQASVETSDPVFNQVLHRAKADLHMLTTDTRNGPYPYAGIPWFSAAFGRDGIITAIQMLWIDPSMAKGVLTFLAATQATETDPDADAEPGKILHETRFGEMARLREVPFGLYYGSVDSTPLYVVLAGLYLERTGDTTTIAALWPHIEAALSWIDDYGDRDGDGFVEYRSGTGLANQGWKDSHDAIFHADGTLAVGPIALCEVQGYVYAAKQHAAYMAERLGFTVKAETLKREAADLQQLFDREFWNDELGYYALALDGDKRQCQVRTSNAGHLLFSGVVEHERAEQIADRLLSRSFFTGWGIRTVAEGEACYNPMSYHNGSVWPHDNALIALGLSRYGLVNHVERLFSGMVDAAAHVDLRRLPELFCGFRRTTRRGPTFYPVACSPQAWAAAAPFAFLQASLGLVCDPATNTVRFNCPTLPRFLDQMTIRGLTIGDSRLDILLRRYGSDVSVNVLEREGDADVAVYLG